MTGAAKALGLDRAQVLELLGAGLVTDDDRTVLDEAGYGQPRGLGHHPALVLVDFQLAYLGDDQPVVEQLATWPTGGGAAAWAAMRRTLPVLRQARERELPVFLTRIAYSAAQLHDGTFARKRGSASAFLDGGPGSTLADELAQTPSDVIVTKPAASAFFATGLHELLQERGVDTILVAGLSTSGCVRATAVDAASYGYSVGVVVDGVADRMELSHRVALLDLWMKYADLLTAADARTYLEAS